MTSKKKHIVSFSGGAASFAAAHLVAEKYGPGNVILVFCDTRIEDWDLYRFVEEGAKKLNCELVRLQDGRDPWQVFKDRKYQGNTRTAHCTVELKGKVFARWLTENHKPDDCVIHFGFDWMENHRLTEAKKNWEPYTCEAVLCDPPYLSRQQVFQIIDDYEMELPRLYELGFSHNNCGGFCVRAGQGHYANLLEKLPDVYAYHEGRQERLMTELPSARPFLRIVRDKKTYYLTLRQYREHLESGGEFVPHEIGGCGCFSDASSCGLPALIATDGGNSDNAPFDAAEWDVWRSYVLS